MLRVVEELLFETSFYTGQGMIWMHAKGDTLLT